MNAAILCSVASWFGLTFLPLRLGVVMSIWAVFLSHNEFFYSLGEVTLKKASDIDQEKLMLKANEQYRFYRLKVSHTCHTSINTMTGLYEILQPVLSKIVLMSLYIATIIDVYFIQKYRTKKQEVGFDEFLAETSKEEGGSVRFQSVHGNCNALSPTVISQEIDSDPDGEGNSPPVD